MNQQLLKMVKIECDAVCVFIYNGENKELDRLLNEYYKYEKVLMKNSLAIKDYISLSTRKPPMVIN